LRRWSGGKGVGLSVRVEISLMPWGSGSCISQPAYLGSVIGIEREIDHPALTSPWPRYSCRRENLHSINLSTPLANPFTDQPVLLIFYPLIPPDSSRKKRLVDWLCNRTTVVSTVLFSSSLLFPQPTQSRLWGMFQLLQQPSNCRVSSEAYPA
jgi:hypothetical protein